MKTVGFRLRIIWFVLLQCVLGVGMGIYLLLMPVPSESDHKQSVSNQKQVVELDAPLLAQDSMPDSAVMQLFQASGLDVDTNEATMEQQVAAQVKLFKEYKRGNCSYVPKVNALVTVNDDISVLVLMALVEHPRSSIIAINALGDIRNHAMQKKIVDFLRSHVDSRHLDIKCAAIESLASAGGDDVLPEMDAYIMENWRSPDGYGEQVCSAIIRGVADVGTHASLMMLGRQLERVDERDWLPDYGTVVVEAISRYNHPRIKEALLRYVDGMTHRLQGVPNGAGQNYIKAKIKEATDAVAELDTKPSVGSADR